MEPEINILLGTGKSKEVDIFQKKPRGLLKFLYEQENYESYPNKIFKNTNCTYTWILLLISELEKKNLIETEKTGRIKKIKLTEKGKLFTEKIIALEAF